MPHLAPVRRPSGVVLSREDGAAVAARSVLSFHVRAVVEQEAGARTGDVHAVHQLRVTTRRLRAALRLLAPVLPVRLTHRMQRELEWLAAAIGAVRDLDVLAQTVRAQVARLDAGSRTALGPLAAALHDRRMAEHAALVAALDSRRHRRLVEQLETFGNSAPPRRQPRLGDVAPDMVQPLLRAVVRAGHRVTPDSPPASLHRLRVRAKRLRYALEMLRGLGGRSVERTLRRLVRLQELLGECQDAVTGIVWLRHWADSAPLAPATLLATGGLIQVLRRRERKLRRRFPGLWDRLDRRRLRSGVRAELAAAPRAATRLALPSPEARAS